MPIDINEIEKLVKRIIPKDFNYELKQSSFSESIYLTIRKDNALRFVRISSHPHPTNQNIKCCYIGKHTKKDKIIKTINNMVKYIRYDIVDNIIELMASDNKQDYELNNDLIMLLNNIFH